MCLFIYICIYIYILYIFLLHYAAASSFMYAVQKQTYVSN